MAAQLLSFKNLDSITNNDNDNEDETKSSDTPVFTNNPSTGDNLQMMSGGAVTEVVLDDHHQDKFNPDFLAPLPPETPKIVIRNADNQLDRISAISKLSSSGLKSASSPSTEPTKHFEIKWRNIDLRTGSKRNFLKEFLTKTPSTVTDNNNTLPFQGNDQLHDENARQILTNLSGSMYSGQLTAILGPSGVGKTTLLNCLTGRNNLEGTGRVKVIGGISKRIAVCTIPQDDILPSELTVKEDLYFTSQIKNLHGGFDHDKNVARVTRLLQVEKCFNTRIKKLSGGETRRLSIARELLSNPDLMILDEPTSGLDANTCWKIISALRSLVEHSDNELDRPMAMIVTIHQPQREVLDLFHKIYVMAQGGHAIYEGPPCSLMSVLVDQTSILKKVHSIDELNENPAIVAIEVASGEYGEDVIMDLADYHTSQLFEQYSEADYYGPSSANGTPSSLRYARRSPLSVSPRFNQLRLQSNNSNMINLSSSNQNHPDHLSTVTFFSTSSDDDLPPSYSKVKVDSRLRRSVILNSHFWRHTYILMKRSWLMTTRNTFLMMIRIVGFILVAMSCVQVFSGALKKDANLCPNFYTEVDNIAEFMTDSLARLETELVEHNTQARSTHLFFFHVILCIIMVTSALTGLIFPLQMRMFLRERKNGWYSLGSFLMSGTLAEMPIDIIGPTIAMTIIYPMCHQPDSYLEWRFFGYTITCILACLACKSQAQIVGALLMNSVDNSVFISCVMVAPQAILSGIAVRISDMYYPLQLVTYGTYLRYAFDNLFILRYGYGQCPCDPQQVVGFPARPTNDAVPPQLENLARGLIDLSTPAMTTTTTTNISEIDRGGNLITSTMPTNEQSPDLFTVLVNLISQANNMFVSNSQQIGSCDTYRSLYLVERDVKDSDLVPWIVIMIAMFVISRFITYFVLMMVMKYQR